jgi:hypothetical protein
LHLELSTIWRWALSLVTFSFPTCRTYGALIHTSV